MEVKYRRELNETYMILEGEAPCEEFALEILRNNRLQGLMPLTVFETDGVPLYYFQITRGNSLFSMLTKRQITYEEIRQLIFSLCRTLEEMERYLLIPDHLILEPEFIYGLPDCSRVAFCCHPAFEKDFFGQLQNLIQYFLEKLDHSDPRGVDTAYEMFQVSRQENFRFEDLLEVVGREPRREEETAAPPPQAAEGQEELWNFSAESGREQTEETRESAVSPVLSVLLLLLAAVFGGLGIRGAQRGETDWRYFAAAGILAAAGIGRMAVLWIWKRRKTSVRSHPSGKSEAPEFPEGRGQEEETCLLGYPSVCPGRWVLSSEDPGRYESVPLDRMPFVIGKSRERTDYSLKFSSVSRIHARFEGQGGECFLTDCGSTNGTYVNGIRLEEGRRRLIREGDEVGLADLKFIFRQEGGH